MRSGREIYGVIKEKLDTVDTLKKLLYQLTNTMLEKHWCEIPLESVQILYQAYIKCQKELRDVEDAQYEDRQTNC